MSQPLASGDIPVVRERRSFADTVRDYIAITKPKHQFVLLTCWASMALSGVSVSAGRALFLLFVTALGVASSHVFNQLYDTDIDKKMPRTKNRPLAAERISRRGATIFGILLGALSIALMYHYVNLLSALLVVAGLVVYVPIYTYWLKRTSPWCTFVGGAAGAMPSLIGWAALTGRLDLVPFLLFSLMVLWQTPHFFALLLFRGDDYRKAGVPMLIVVSGVEATLRQLAVYSVLMVATTVLIYMTGASGVVFLTLSLLAGGAFLAGAIKANIDGPSKAPMWGKRLFFSSYLYLGLVFVSVALDRIV